MDKKWKVTVIAAVVLLVVAAGVFAQSTGNSQNTGDQMFSMDESVWCGGPRGYSGGGYGGCGGPGSFNEPDNGGGYGNGGGFNCH